MLSRNHLSLGCPIIGLLLLAVGSVYAEAANRYDTTVPSKEECIALRSFPPEKQFEIVATGTEAQAEVVLADLAFPGNAVLRNFDGLMKQTTGPHAALVVEKIAGGLGRTCRSDPQMKDLTERFLMPLRSALDGQNMAISTQKSLQCLHLLLPPGLSSDSLSHYPLEEVKEILYLHLQGAGPNVRCEIVDALMLLGLESPACAHEVIGRLQAFQASLPARTEAGIPESVLELHAKIAGVIEHINSILQNGYFPNPYNDGAAAELLCKPTEEQLANAVRQAGRADLGLLDWGNAFYDNFAAIMKIAQKTCSDRIIERMVDDVLAKPDNGLRRAALDELVTFLDESTRTETAKLDRGKLVSHLAWIVPGGREMSPLFYRGSPLYGNDRVYEIMMRYINDPDATVRYTAVRFLVVFAGNEPSKIPEVLPIAEEWQRNKIPDTAESKDLRILRYGIESCLSRLGKSNSPGKGARIPGRIPGTPWVEFRRIPGTPYLITVKGGDSR